MKMEYYRSHVIGFSTKKKMYLWDSLTARAIRLHKAEIAVDTIRRKDGRS